MVKIGFLSKDTTWQDVGYEIYVLDENRTHELGVIMTCVSELKYYVIQSFARIGKLSVSNRTTHVLLSINKLYLTIKTKSNLSSKC